MFSKDLENIWNVVSRKSSFIYSEYVKNEFNTSLFPTILLPFSSFSPDSGYIDVSRKSRDEILNTNLPPSPITTLIIFFGPNGLK